MARFQVIIERLREPSTWGALMGLFLLLGFTQEQAKTFFLAGSGIAMFLTFFLKEKGGSK